MAEGQKYHCGPKNAPKWLRRIASYRFNDACYIHDLDFSKDSKYTIKEANERFLIYMVRSAKRNIFWLSMAIIYYYAVSKKGEDHYEGNAGS